MRPLRVGIQLPEVERVVRWTEYVALARAAEAAGFDSIWVGDHILYRGDGRPERGPWEAWSLLAALAAVTERVHLGPLVACTAFSPPALLAKRAAAVQEISGGRLVLGLGAGWNEAEFRSFGLPFDHRVARFEESFEVIRRLMAGERVTLHGAFIDVADAVLLPIAAQRVPLMIGSNSPRMLSIALPYVDRWNTWFDGYGNTADGFAARSRSSTRPPPPWGAGPRTSSGVPASSSCSTLPRTTAPSRRGSSRSKDRCRASPRVCAIWPRPGRTRRSSSRARSPSARSPPSARPSRSWMGSR